MQTQQSCQVSTASPNFDITHASAPFCLLVKKLVLCAWFSSDALEVWSFWLKLPQRIHYKMASLTYNTLQTSQPTYTH